MLAHAVAVGVVNEGRWVTGVGGGENGCSVANRFVKSSTGSAIKWRECG